MKRVLRLVALLYPRWWRQRYGDEFNAFVEELALRWTDVPNVTLEACRMRLTNLRLRYTVAGTCFAVLGLFTFQTVRPVAHQYYVTMNVVGDPDAQGFASALRQALDETAVAAIVARHHLYNSVVTTGRSPVEQFKQNSGVILSREHHIVMYFNGANLSEVEGAGRDMMNAVLNAKVPGGGLQLAAPPVLGHGRLPLPRLTFWLGAIGGSLLGFVLGGVRERLGRRDLIGPSVR